MKSYCLNCNETTNCEKVGDYTSKSELFKNKLLYRCLGCGLIFIYPTVAQEDLDVYYNSVWLNDENIISTSDNMNIIYRIQAKERFKYLNSHIHFIEDMKILDVGAGFGYLLNEFKRNLNNPILCATETNKLNINRLRKMRAKVANEIGGFNGEKFDLVNICFVLEHIINPKEFLRDVLKYVKKGGYVFIDLPERDDTFKEMLEPHVVVFTTDSFKNMVDKLDIELLHMTGYGVEREKLVELKGQPASASTRIRRIKLLLGRSKKTRKLYGLLKYFSNKILEKAIVQKYYNQFKFHEEGNNRWWFRAIFRRT